MKFEASQSRQMSQQRQFLSPHPFARRYKTGAVPRPVSLKAAISAQTNAPERAESISGHPAPGTLRLGRTEPCHRLRIRTISAARAKPYAPAPFGRVRRKRRTRSPNNRGRNACALPFAVCTNVPVLMKESYLWHAESGSTPALCHPQDERSHPHKRRNNIPNSSERNARARQFSERATVLAADAFDRPLRFRITRREGKDEHPFLFVLESPIYKSFRRKKPAPALHTAIYHTRRKRRLTAAVRLCKNGRHSPATGVQAQPCLFSHFLCFDAFGKKPQSGLARTTGTAGLTGMQTQSRLFSCFCML